MEKLKGIHYMDLVKITDEHNRRYFGKRARVIAVKNDQATVKIFLDESIQIFNKSVLEKVED